MQLIEATIPWVPQRGHRSKSEEWKALRAHEMRLAPTAAEKILWGHLRKSQTGFQVSPPAAAVWLHCGFLVRGAWTRH
jgi:hypothetical protein